MGARNEAGRTGEANGERARVPSWAAWLTLLRVIAPARSIRFLFGKQTVHMVLVETEIQGEGSTHRRLWQICQHQLRQADAEQVGAFTFYAGAMLFAYFTYEAYLNFLGDRIDYETWKNEREFFGKKPYRGFEGKLKKLAEVSEFVVEKGKRPYQSISDLTEFRHLLTHGKPDKYQETTTHFDHQMPPLYGYGTLDPWVDADRARLIVKDVAEFIEHLHGHCLQKYQSLKNDGLYGESALQGPLALRTISSKAK